MLFLIPVAAPPFLHVGEHHENGHDGHVAHGVISRSTQRLLPPFDSKSATPVEGDRVKENLPLPNDDQQQEEEWERRR